MTDDRPDREEPPAAKGRDATHEVAGQELQPERGKAVEGDDVVNGADKTDMDAVGDDGQVFGG